jgi:hypothetical protein
MKLVQLKNGSEELDTLVTVTMVSLESLLQSAPIVFYELVVLCRDSNHQLFGNAGERLEELGLVTLDGTGQAQVHGSIRNVVLSAVTGDGLEMSLGSPI